MVTCAELEKPPHRYCSAIVNNEKAGRRTLLVTPRGDERTIGGQVHHTFTFDAAIEHLSEGTTILLLPGKYYRAVELLQKRGSEKKPIVIEGTTGPDGRLLSQICGTNAAGSIYPDLPHREDYAFIKMRGCRHIIVRNLNVESCWPSFLYAERTSSIAVEDVRAQDGTYLVFVRGPEARDFTVRGCRWVQDPTGTLWSAIDWEQSHEGLYAYYNGALVEFRCRRRGRRRGRVKRCTTRLQRGSFHDNR